MFHADLDRGLPRRPHGGKSGIHHSRPGTAALGKMLVVVRMGLQPGPMFWEIAINKHDHP